MTEPRYYTWIFDRRCAVTERPGGGGRSHRQVRRSDELEWWRSQGARTLVSGMGTRHGLLDAALAGFQIAWHPLVDPITSRGVLGELASQVGRLLEDPSECVVVHVDRPGEWLAAVDGALRRKLGLCTTTDEMIDQIRGDGLPFGETAASLLDVDAPTNVGQQTAE